MKCICQISSSYFSMEGHNIGILENNLFHVHCIEENRPKDDEWMMYD